MVCVDYQSPAKVTYTEDVFVRYFLPLLLPTSILILLARYIAVNELIRYNHVLLLNAYSLEDLS